MSTHRTDTPLSSARTIPSQRGYFGLSASPLHVLVFLIPVIIAAEMGTLGLANEGIGAQLAAHRMLVRFFDLFGVVGLHLPALAIAVTLLVQHVLSKDRWKIEPIVPAAMVVESAFLTGPLLILVLILQQPVAEALAATVNEAGTLSPRSGILLALGAGLYEEVLFRLVIITGIHFVAADLFRIPDSGAKFIAVVASAVLFALHHDTTGPDGAIQIRLFAFYVLAGLYFGLLFLTRGLGIAVGVHAIYDLLVLVVMPGVASSSA